MGPAMRMDWRKVHIAYLNHRCVPESDPKSAHSLAREVFLDALPMFPNVSTVDGELVSPETPNKARD